MTPAQLTGIVAAILAFILCLRLLAGAMDSGRIRRYLEKRGGRLVSKRWTPFGKGWFGEGNERLYAIEYDDDAGCRHRVAVKTSLFTGVFLTDDRLTGAGAPSPHDELEQLRAENERLSAENERLRAEMARRGDEEPTG